MRKNPRSAKIARNRTRRKLQAQVSELRHQQHAAFDALYQNHRHKVWAVAYAHYPNWDAAADITQEAFLRLGQKWAVGAVIDNTLAWLKRVAKNLALSRGRKGATASKHCEPVGRYAARRQAGVDPQAELERSEQGAMVEDALASLPASDRELLEMKVVEGLTIDQIVAMRHSSRSVVNRQLAAARERLRQAVQARLYGRSGNPRRKTVS